VKFSDNFYLMFFPEII